MSCVDNTIKIGDMVIRAYAFDIEEFGLVVDTKPWRETVLIPEVLGSNRSRAFWYYLYPECVFTHGLGANVDETCCCIP